MITFLSASSNPQCLSTNKNKVKWNLNPFEVNHDYSSALRVLWVLIILISYVEGTG